MTKRATENIIDHIDGTAVVTAEEKDGLVAVNCPFCDDAHADLKTTEKNLQMIYPDCREWGYWLWTEEPDDFDPTDHIRPDFIDGKFVHHGFDEDGHLTICCIECFEQHQFDVLDAYADERGEIIDLELPCANYATAKVLVPEQGGRDG